MRMSEMYIKFSWCALANVTVGCLSCVKHLMCVCDLLCLSLCVSKCVNLVPEDFSQICVIFWRDAVLMLSAFLQLFLFFSAAMEDSGQICL